MTVMGVEGKRVKVARGVLCYVFCCAPVQEKRRRRRLGCQRLGVDAGPFSTVDTFGR